MRVMPAVPPPRDRGMSSFASVWSKASRATEDFMALALGSGLGPYEITAALGAVTS